MTAEGQVPSSSGAQVASLGKLARLHALLTRNEIFFKTVLSASLTGTSIVVAISSLRVATASKEAAVAQERMARDKEMPMISARTVLTVDPDSQRATREALVVSNLNSYLREARVDHLEFFTFRYVEGSKRRFVWVPIWNYYATTWNTAALTGEIATLEGICKEGNNARAANLEHEFDTLPLLSIAEAGIERFVRVTYRDRFGGTHDDTYHVEPILGSALVAPEEALSVRAMHERRSSHAQDICAADLTSLTAALRAIVDEEPNEQR